MKCLVYEHDVDPNAKTAFGGNALLSAVRGGYENIVDWLLRKMPLKTDKKMDINADQEGMTPLMWAAQRGHNAIVQLLLDHGADHLLKNNQNQTAEDIAREYGKTSVTWTLDRFEGEAQDGADILTSALGISV